MWAVTSYYNPAQFKRRLENFKIFRANLGVPLVTVELSFNGYFELTENDADILIQIFGGAVLWQKERLLNLAIKSVPSHAKNIAWIDCDVVFDNPDWMDEAELQLEKVNIVQPYSEVVDLEPDGHRSNFRELCSTGRGLVSLINGDARAQIDAATALWGTPEASAAKFRIGIAWAARRAILENHGLYDAMIVGGGDRAMLHAIYGQFDKETQLHHLNKSHQEHYLKWAQPFHRAIAEKVGHVSGRIYHLWHGDFFNRNYSSRHRIFSGFDFEPDVDLVVGPNGARPRPELERFLVNYFIGRAEDE
jgi:glycosyltransferase involved in cell wall biosynthesis